MAVQNRQRDKRNKLKYVVFKFAIFRLVTIHIFFTKTTRHKQQTIDKKKKQTHNKLFFGIRHLNVGRQNGKRQGTTEK